MKKANLLTNLCSMFPQNDHNGCPTCECSDPCEGYQCPMGNRCEVAKDPECVSGSSLCASEPVCKPDVAYSNPCDIGTPFSDNSTGEVFYCLLGESIGFTVFDEECVNNNCSHL